MRSRSLRFSHKEKAEMEAFEVDTTATDCTQSSRFQFLSRFTWRPDRRHVKLALLSFVIVAGLAVTTVTVVKLRKPAQPVGTASVHAHKDLASGGEKEAASEAEALRLPGASLQQGLQEGHADKVHHPVEFNPRQESLQGTNYVWQIPANPSAVVFFAHGCGQDATMFWDRSSSCPACSGMPEDRSLTLAALKRGFAVIAVKSQGKCWNASWPPEASKDILGVERIVKSWTAENNLGSLALHALGISSGGYFVTVLAHRLHFQSMAVYISSGVKRSFVSKMPNGSSFPPTLFVHMPKDNFMAGQVSSSIKLLHRNKVQAASLPCREIPLTPEYFSLRIIGLNGNVSAKIYGILKVENFLNRDGYLQEDPRKSKWREALKKHAYLRDMGSKRLKWEREISEELNLAYAFHELTSLKVTETFDWFKNRCLNNGRYRHKRCSFYPDKVVTHSDG